MSKILYINLIISIFWDYDIHIYVPSSKVLHRWALFEACAVFTLKEPHWLVAIKVPTMWLDSENQHPNSTFYLFFPPYILFNFLSISQQPNTMYQSISWRLSSTNNCLRFNSQIFVYTFQHLHKISSIIQCFMT